MIPRWEAFVEVTNGRPPREELVKALAYLGRKGKAIDLGAGALNETRYLLAQGFEVTAIDSEPASAEAAHELNDDKLDFHAEGYESFDFPKEKFDLAVALYSLPFAPKAQFERTVRGTLDSIKPGGIFVGNLFGQNDEWNDGATAVNFVSESAAKDYFEAFDILEWGEEKGPGGTATGETKYWHIYHAIAKKK